MADQRIIRVNGIPVAKGSTVSFRSASTGAVVTKNSGMGLGPWMDAIAKVAFEAGIPIATGGVKIGMGFALPAPKSRRGGNLQKPHTTRPDIDKLARAVLDALTGVAYIDDSQVTGITSEKHYASVQVGEIPGVTLVISST